MADAATSTMVWLGTPAHMLLELVQGKDPTPQSDIYSLGVVLYEMFTGGERPFTGDHAKTTGTTSEKVRWEQVHLNPSSPLKYNNDISPEIELVILKCLSKDPKDRYTSAMELIGEINKETQNVNRMGSFVAQGDHNEKHIQTQNAVDDRTSSAEGLIQHKNRNKGEKQYQSKSKRLPSWLSWAGGGVAGGLIIGLVLLFVFLTGKPAVPYLSNPNITRTLTQTEELVSTIVDTNNFVETKIPSETLKSTNTVTSTNTFTPTKYLTNTPTFTFIPSFTDTIQLTNTPRPTDTAMPSNTPQPTNTVIPTIPSLPVPGDFYKLSPADGVTGLSLDVTFHWESSSNTEYYEICVTTSTSCKTGTMTASTNFTVSGLTANTTYHWQVIAINSSGSTLAKGDLWTFSTGN